MDSIPVLLLSLPLAPLSPFLSARLGQRCCLHLLLINRGPFLLPPLLHSGKAERERGKGRREEIPWKEEKTEEEEEEEKEGRGVPSPSSPRALPSEARRRFAHHVRRQHRAGPISQHCHLLQLGECPPPPSPSGGRGRILSSVFLLLIPRSI